MASRFEKHLPEVEKFMGEAKEELQEKLKAVREAPAEKVPYLMEEMEQWVFSLSGDIKALNKRMDKLENLFKGIE